MAMMAATTLTLTPPRWSWRPTRRSFCRQMHPGLRGLGMYRNGGSNELNVSAWDDKPFEMLPSGNKAYLDEQDVVTFLDPPKDLIPFDPSSYNPAAYLWKKIEDIPQERRHRLLRLLKPRLVSIAWQIAGTRFDDPKLVKKSASTLLSSSTNDGIMLECYNCTSSGGPMSISWINSFRKAIFTGKDGQAYGRIIKLKEVMSTEQPCDLAYEFGDGLHDIKELPLGFPRPVKHPYPFNDQIVVYVRYLGPGVSVGQAWQEGTKLEQVPRKLCGEILMVKDYTSLQEDQ
ncbi:hypothetical protein AAZV13_07G003300 [Glycine max]